MSFNSFGSREFLETRKDEQMIETLLNSLYRTGKTPCEAFSFRISMKQIQNGTNLLNSGINFQFWQERMIEICLSILYTFKFI